MTLVKPSLPAASAGQPITAQAWNAIVTAVGQLFDGVNAFGSDAVTVALSAGGVPVTNAVVVAAPGSGQPIVAVPPHGATTSFTLTQLTPGTWTITVAAPNFQPATQTVTVPASAPVSIALTATTKPMPNLYGRSANEALTILGVQGIAIDGIVDVFGAEISKTSLPVDHNNARVLVQFPQPDAPIVAASAAVRLVLSAQPPTQKEAAKDTKDAIKEVKEITKDIKDVKEEKVVADKVDKAAALADKTAEKAAVTPDKTAEKAATTPEKAVVSDKVQSDTVAIARPASDSSLLPPPVAAVARVADSRVFIAPAERPSVGEATVHEPREE